MTGPPGKAHQVTRSAPTFRSRAGCDKRPVTDRTASQHEDSRAERRALPCPLAAVLRPRQRLRTYSNWPRDESSRRCRGAHGHASP